MALTYAQGFILLLLSSLWASSMAARRLIVGGSQKWAFGVNYADWALQNQPFQLNDTLVFQYDPPIDNNTRPHNVYLLPSLSNFVSCNLSGAQLLANESQGGGDGFEFVLDKAFQPYYFACGIGNGFHCNSGSMRFRAVPFARQ